MSTLRFNGFRWFLFLLCFCFASVQAPAKEPPNIVFILADDLGYGDLGCYGHPRILSSNIDQLAKDGVRLTHCYSASGVCSPSRSAILTGRTPYRNGCYTWIDSGSEAHLRKTEITLPTLLKQAGYSTAHVGKWHLNGMFNSPQQPQPNDHGYDYWLATQNNAAPSHKNPSNFVRNGQAVGPLEGFSALLLADEATRWLRNGRDKSKPFFLSVWHHEPHLPIETDPKFQQPLSDLDADTRQHHGNVAQLDAAVGRILAELKAQKLDENTIVIFTSDNGPEGDGKKGRLKGTTGGLRGRKATVYEGGIRVPGIIRFPGRIPAGSISDVPMIGSDFMPTLVSLGGARLPTDRVLDGVNVFDCWTGKAKSVDRLKPLFWRLNLGRPQDVRHLALQKDGWKIIANLEMTEVELYHLAKDPAESNDLAKAEPQKLAEMKQALVQLNAEVEKEGPDWWKRLSPAGARTLVPKKKKE